ncbi:unnamed protein product [Closterium sp. NIES-53]
MEVARTSMIHAAAPHFLWSFAVWYAAHQLNLWPRVSLPKTLPTLYWTGKVGDASVFRVWGSRAFVRDTSADKLSACAIPFVFLGFVPDDVTFDKSVPFYRLFPYRSAPPPPPPLFLAPGPPLVHPLPPQGRAPLGVSQVDPLLGTVPLEVAVDSGAARGAASAGAVSGGVEPMGAEPGGAEPGGAESEGAKSGGAEPKGPAPSGVSQVDPLPGTVPDEVAGDSGAARGAASGGAVCGVAEPGGAELGGAESEGVEPGGAVYEGAESRGSEPRVTASAGGLAAHPPFSGATGAGDPAAGDIGAGGAATSGPRGARTRGNGAARTGSVVGAGAGGTGAGGAKAGEAGAVDPGAGGAGAWGCCVWWYWCSRHCAAAAVLSSPASTVAAAVTASIPTAFSFSSKWQAAMDAEMASRKSTGTYIDAAPPSQANIVDGMWIFRVKRSSGSPPAFKARYVARGLRQPARGDLAALPTWLHWVVPCRTTLAALGFSPSTTDSSLLLRTDTPLPPFYVVLYVLQRFGFQFSSPQPTPLSTGHSLSAPSSDESVELIGPYPELVGCLIYLMTTSGMGLVLGGRGPVVLTSHADASWVDDSATQRSSQGYTFSLGFDSVSWRSTCSSPVLSSICEAEIYAGAMAAQELRLLTYLLTDLGEQPRLPPVLYVDNKAMIALCQEHRLEHRTKHVALRYFLAQELQQHGQLRLAYVVARANTVDIFTKALPPGDHQRFSTVLGLVPTLPHLLTA